MALPAHVLDRLPESLRKNRLIFTSDGEARRSFLRSEGPEETFGPLSGRFVPGGITEIVSRGGSLGTSVFLYAIRKAQERARSLGVELPLVAVVTRGGSLFAPGVEHRGVEFSRVLVVEPEDDSFERVVLKIVESRIFSFVVIDLIGTPGVNSVVPLGNWVRILRRLAPSLEGSERSVLVLTSEASPRPLPLPVSERWELKRTSAREISVRSVKREPGFRRVEWGLDGPRENSEIREKEASRDLALLA